MSTDSLKSGKSSQSPSVQLSLVGEKSFSYVQLTCSFCKFKKRKCNGENPCSNCKKHNQTCAYFADNDRRRRKYHTDYINYLEDKSEVLSKFVNEFVKDSPELSNAFHQKLSEVIEVSQSKSEENMDRTRDATSDQLDEHLLKILDEASRLKLDEDDNSRFVNSTSLLNHSNEYEDVDLEHHVSPYSELTSSTFDAIDDEETNPLTMSGLNVVFKDESFRTHLTDSFEQNFSLYFHCFTVILPEVRSWKFSSSVPSKQLLMCSIFAVGAVYSDHPYALKSRKLFIAELEYIAVDSCRYPLDVYLVMGLTLLSMYELGMGNDSISYLFDSMSCSLTQHMGLHISYDEYNDSKSANYAPRPSPVRSSILWGICLQDRIITSICNVQACIHFKRIIAPAYQTVLGPESPQYIAELSFASQSRLWYIFDRFMDQICSENGDIGDTQQRTKLLETALNSLSEFKNSLPSPLMLTKENNNKFVMMLHYTYYGLISQYYKAFIKITPDATQKLLQNSVILAKILARFQKDNKFEILPYYAGYLIYSNALTYLIFLTNHKDEVYMTPEQEALYRSFRSYFSDCVALLKALSKFWKRSKKDLTILTNLCLQAGMHFPELNETTYNGSQSSYLTSQTQTPEAYLADFSTNKFSFMSSPAASSNDPGEFDNDRLNFDPSHFFNSAVQPPFVPPSRPAPPPPQSFNAYQQRSQPHQSSPMAQWDQRLLRQAPLYSQPRQQHQPAQQHIQQSYMQQTPQPMPQPIPVQNQSRFPIPHPLQREADVSQVISPPLVPSGPTPSFFPMSGDPISGNDGFVELMNQFYPSFDFNVPGMNINLEETERNPPVVSNEHPAEYNSHLKSTRGNDIRDPKIPNNKFG